MHTEKTLKLAGDIVRSQRELEIKGVLETNFIPVPIGPVEDFVYKGFSLDTPVKFVNFTDNKKEEETMYNIEQQKIDYLERRLEVLVYQKRDELYREFGIRDENAPQTPKEFVERILAGKFILPDEDHDDDFCCSPAQAIIWRDPSVKKDYDGFNKAEKEMLAARTEVKDAIMIKSAEEGLAALKDFESKTFH